MPVEFEISLPSVLSTVETDGVSSSKARGKSKRGSAKGSRGYPMSGRVKVTAEGTPAGALIEVLVCTDQPYLQFDGPLDDSGLFNGRVYLDKNTPTIVLRLRLRRAGELIAEHDFRCEVQMPLWDRIRA